MNNKKAQLFSSLFWKISAAFLGILTLFGLLSIIISINGARHYHQEVNQELNRHLAQHTAEEIKPFLKNGEINQQAVGDIMHSMMVINPSVEVYILNTKGDILSYVAPKKVVKLKTVSIDNINKFLTQKPNRVVLGDDPRNPGEQKIFSAAKVVENNQHIGYIYIVLASQVYVGTSQALLGSYILGLSVKSFGLVFIISLFVGLVFFWFITRELNNMVVGISSFERGNFKTRLPLKSSGELNKVATTFNQMANTIEQNIEKLKGMDQLRKELIINISHDLRTPIAAIQGYAETLELKDKTLLPAERLKYVSIIVRNCVQLKKMVSDLFELAKLETNQVMIQKESFSLSELVHDIVNKHRILSQKKGININTHMPNKPTLVSADVSMIDRVLQNLIENAVKFCKDGDTIQIEINNLTSDAIEVKVIDSGNGIAQEELPYIFERYYKGHSGTSSLSTGLGLAIVKKIVELHGSKIDVYSQLSKGTSFRFTLPTAST